MMDNKENIIDSTILNTPEPAATSTLQKSSKVRKNSKTASVLDFDSSLGILSVEHLSGLSDRSNDISQILQKQRNLTRHSLNQVSALPSRYFKPSSNVSKTESESDFSLLSESSISESDLLQTPKNRSTPRESLVDSALDVPRLDEKMARLSLQLKQNSGLDIDHFTNEFNKAISTANTSVTSEMFLKSGEVDEKLLADEMSWRHKHEIPERDVEFSVLSNDSIDPSKMSMGEYFKAGSDELLEIKNAVSPMRRGRPVPLINDSYQSNMSGVSMLSTNKDITNTFDESATSDRLGQFLDEVLSKPNKSLSISHINNLLSQTNTPTKLLEMLLQPKELIQNEPKIAEPTAGSDNASYTGNYPNNELYNRTKKKQRQPESEANTDISESRQSNLDYHVKGFQSTEISKKTSLNPEQCGPERSDSTSPTASSVRSSSCLSNLPNGKLPIESTAGELVWGCVKVDKCQTQNFMIRNKSGKSIRIQCSIKGHNFRIRKDNRSESDSLSAAKILLHGYESRQINVSFMPASNGAAIDEISFTSLDANLQQTKKQCVRLFGYGGYSQVELSTVRDVTGKSWLSLGKLDNTPVCCQKFTVKNTGNLAAFCYFQFVPKRNYSFTTVTVKPFFFSLHPNQWRDIEVSYETTSKDHKSIQNNQSNILEIGNIIMTHSDDINRFRLRRLCRKAVESGVPLEPLCKELQKKTEDEIIPSDYQQFKETLNSMKDILGLFMKKEIVLTLEIDPEQTLMPQYHDDSELFNTLCVENTIVETTMFPKDCCKLEPSSIILTPPSKTEDCLLLSSDNSKTVHFEAISNPEGLEIIPKQGKINSGETVALKVIYSKSLTHKMVYKVLIYVDNDVLDAEVKVMFLNTKVR